MFVNCYLVFVVCCLLFVGVHVICCLLLALLLFVVVVCVVVLLFAVVWLFCCLICYVGCFRLSFCAAITGLQMQQIGDESAGSALRSSIAKRRAQADNAICAWVPPPQWASNSFVHEKLKVNFGSQQANARQC